MSFVYLFISGSEWEDMVLFLSQEEAIDASIKYPNSRVEIFGKEKNSIGYIPTYSYYKNGAYFMTK